VNCSGIKYLVLSDIHLGHNRTKTDYIINNLEELFRKNHSKFKKLDIIFLAGDVFDKLLSSCSDELIASTEWLSKLAMYCVSNHIRLRVLEGTPSHDWKQMALFATTLKALCIDIDYKYIDYLNIEYMEDLGINILYVPDEWNRVAGDTLDDVNLLLSKRGIKKVDIAIMHGQFNYQLPMIELESSHNEDAYHELVKYYINIGHIHTPSVYNRILAQGSFDRLAHNEEEDKGCILVNIYHTGDMDFLFIKNPNPQPYKKYDLSTMETSKIVKFLDRELNKLKLGTRVKLVVSNTTINKLLIPIKDKYKDLIITIDKKKKVIDSDKVVNNRVVFTPFEITKDNIKELLLQELSKYDISTIDINLVTSELDEIINIP